MRDVEDEAWMPGGAVEPVRSDERHPRGLAGDARTAFRSLAAALVAITELETPL